MCAGSKIKHTTLETAIMLLVYLYKLNGKKKKKWCPHLKYTHFGVLVENEILVVSCLTLTYIHIARLVNRAGIQTHRDS